MLAAGVPWYSSCRRVGVGSLLCAHSMHRRSSKEEEGAGCEVESVEEGGSRRKSGTACCWDDGPKDAPAKR